MNDYCVCASYKDIVEYVRMELERLALWQSTNVCLCRDLDDADPLTVELRRVSTDGKCRVRTRFGADTFSRDGVDIIGWAAQIWAEWNEGGMEN